MIISLARFRWILSSSIPHGREEKIPFDVKIKDASGKQIAECAGDICDLKQKIKEHVTFVKGNYKVTINECLQRRVPA